MGGCTSFAPVLPARPRPPPAKRRRSEEATKPSAADTSSRRQSGAIFCFDVRPGRHEEFHRLSGVATGRRCQVQRGEPGQVVHVDGCGDVRPSGEEERYDSRAVLVRCGVQRRRAVLRGRRGGGRGSLSETAASV